VLISVLAMAAGLNETLRSSARDDRAIVVRNGASDEAGSLVTREAALTIMDAPGIRRDPTGKPIASAEVIIITSLKLAGDGTEAQVSMRGVGPDGAALRPEVRIESGRMFHPGVNELIAGKRAGSRFADLKIGDEPLIGGQAWQVVGVFNSDSAHDSELLTDADTLMNAFGRNEYQSVTVQLESAGTLAKLRDSLRAVSSLPVEVFSEKDFFERQSTSLNKVLKVIAYVVGGIMAFGAIFAALNIMYSAVSARSVEIATLRGIGYGPDAMIIAVLAEALALAFLGGIVGALLSWLIFNGYDLSTVSGSGAQLVFELAVTPKIVIVGILWACVIGFIGGILPALQAARLPVAVAIRAG
jgi:putative ABC transport system permease protein